MFDIAFTKNIGQFSLGIKIKDESKILALLGPSGAGKSLTLQCISGLLNPNKGRIAINEKVFFSTEEKIALIPQERKVGYVFQNYALFPHLTVQKNVGFGIKNAPEKEKKERVLELIDRVGLKGYEGRKPKELSGGQQQRVAFARALAIEPNLLLLDEPFSALDQNTKNQLYDEFMELSSKHNIPTILVTHNIEEAKLLCDNIVYIEKGRIKETDI